MRLTHEGHVSHVCNHTHQIPSEILQHFDLSHLSVAQRDQEIQNCHKYRTLYHTKNQSLVNLMIYFLKGSLKEARDLRWTTPNNVTNLGLEAGLRSRVV